MNIGNINQKLKEIWRNNESFIKEKNEEIGKSDKEKTMPCPIFSQKITEEDQGKVLFIGMNPSFNEEFVKKAIIQSKIDMQFDDIYKWSSYTDEDIAKIQTMDSWALTTNIKGKFQHPYFSKFDTLLTFEEIDVSTAKPLLWNHIDLFFYRETNQRDFKKKIIRQDQGKLNSFGNDQIKLTKELIIEYNPCLIIVVNAFASELIKKEIFSEKEIKFDESKGYDLFTWGENLKDVPIFFSSMLTGQRALDKHSFKRLKWHVKQALQDKKKI